MPSTSKTYCRYYHGILKMSSIVLLYSLAMHFLSTLDVITLIVIHVTLIIESEPKILVEIKYLRAEVEVSIIIA